MSHADISVASPANWSGLNGGETPTLSSIEKRLERVTFLPDAEGIGALASAFTSWAAIHMISTRDRDDVLDLLKAPACAPTVTLPAELPQTQLTLVLCVATVVGTRLKKGLAVDDIVQMTVRVVSKHWKSKKFRGFLLSARQHKVHINTSLCTETLPPKSSNLSIQDAAPDWAKPYLDDDQGLNELQRSDLGLRGAYKRWKCVGDRTVKESIVESTFSQRCFALWIGAMIVHDPKCLDANQLLPAVDKALHLAAMLRCIIKAIDTQADEVNAAVIEDEFHVLKFFPLEAKYNLRDIVSKGNTTYAWIGHCELYGIPLLFRDVDRESEGINRLITLQTIALHKANTRIVECFEAPSAAQWPLPIVYGDSGSGKTISALASCMVGGTGVAVYFMMGSVLETLMREREHAPQLAPRSQQQGEFDAAVERCVVGMAAAFDIHPMAKLETEHVVLVIDEAGEERFADIVRALCVCHERICCSVGQLWKCANVRMVVCGTGSEGALLAPGSLPSTYQLINIADTSTCEAFFVGAVCKALKDQMTTLEALLRPAAPTGGDEARSQVYPLLHQRSQEDAARALARDPLLLFARRLLFNRRIAAALVRVLCSLALKDTEVNWHQTLPVVLYQAVSAYRGLNGFSYFDWSGCCGWGRVALALCLGGVEQAPPTGRLAQVRSRFGLIVDRAAAADPSRVPEFDLGNGCVLCSSPEHMCHRFAISAAMYELVMSDFGVNAAGHGRDGVGFDRTIAEAVHVWLLGALRREVAIAPLLPVVATAALEAESKRARDADAPGAVRGSQQEAAHKLHACLRRFACGDDERSEIATDVFFVTMETQLRNAADCWTAAQAYATSVGSAQGGVIGAVLLNGAKAPYADVIGVVGRLGQAAPFRLVLIQCKHVQKAIGDSNVKKEVRKLLGDDEKSSLSVWWPSTLVDVVVVELVSDAPRCTHRMTLGGALSLVMDDDSIRMAIYPVPLAHRLSSDTASPVNICSSHCVFSLRGDAPFDGNGH